MKVIIIGDGEEVNFLIKSFLNKGDEVTYISEKEELCQKLARKYEKIEVVLGDASKPYILEEAEAEYADVLISIKNRDQDNLIICQIAKNIFKISKILAVVKNPENISLFKKLGLDSVISPTSIISSIIEQKVIVEEITNLMEIEEKKATVLQIQITRELSIVGKALKDIKFPNEAVIGCILRENGAIVPRGETVILENDRLIVICLPEVEKEIMNFIRGEEK